MFARKKLSSEDLKYLREVFEEYTDDEFNTHLEDQQSMLEELVDRHGTGRVIFRNSRDSLTGFPKKGRATIRTHAAREATKGRAGKTPTP